MVVALGSVLGTIQDVVDELREEGVKIGRRRDQVLPALSARGGARGAWPRAARGGAREGVRRRGRRHRRAERAARAVGAPHDACTTWSPGWAAGRSRSARCARCWPTPSRTGSRPRPSSTWTGSSSSASSSAQQGDAPARPARREHPARHRDRRRTPALGGRRALPADQVLPSGQLRGRQSPAADPEQRSVQARTERSNSLTSGHRACQGCGEALGARYALDAAMRATAGQADRRQRHRLPRGLLDALPRVVLAAARGSTRCSATRRPWPPGSRRR